jgi:hypothetical protein
MKRLVRWEKFKKMRTICLGFTSSPGGDIIIVIESMSKHGHPGLRGTSHGHMSTELSHVEHYDEIFEGLIERNKIVQQDSNYGPFIN